MSRLSRSARESTQPGPRAARRAQEAALAVLAHRLANDELEALLLIGARVRAGHREYGSLNLRRDSRDFASEAVQELGDATFYLAVHLLRHLRRRGHRRARRVPLSAVRRSTP